MLINYIINVHILKLSKFFLVVSIFKYNTSNSFKINLRRSKASDFYIFLIIKNEYPLPKIYTRKVYNFRSLSIGCIIIIK